MKAIITQKSELTLNLTQHFTFDVISDEGEAILTSQTVECVPSNAVNEIKSRVQAYEAEYQVSQELPEGLEIS